MDNTKSASIAKWYTELVLAFNTLSEQLGLDPEATSELRSFMIEKCKEQFKIGSSSGCSWLRKTLIEQGVKLPPPPARTAVPTVA